MFVSCFSEIAIPVFRKSHFSQVWESLPALELSWMVSMKSFTVDNPRDRLASIPSGSTR
jgi:hypothetical protein